MVTREEPEPGSIDPRMHEAYADIARSEKFQALRRRYLMFAVPATIAFMVWYVLYVVFNNWARDFMSIQVLGNVNIALLFGLLQFVSTFLIAILYARHAGKSLDPDAQALHDQFDARIKSEGVDS
jgi:uncharacterized membrane protein (DUF485 family)